MVIVEAMYTYYVLTIVTCKAYCTFYSCHDLIVTYLLSNKIGYCEPQPSVWCTSPFTM